MDMKAFWATQVYLVNPSRVEDPFRYNKMVEKLEKSIDNIYFPNINYVDPCY